jgi:hypothetical protein
MNYKKIFQEQLEKSLPLTKEVIATLKHNDDYKEGDVLVYARTFRTINESDNDKPQLILELIVCSIDNCEEKLSNYTLLNESHPMFNPKQPIFVPNGDRMLDIN